MSIGVAFIGLAVAGAALSEMRFTDPVGDSAGGAPDITQVTVSNDATGAVLTFRVTTVAPIGNDVTIFVDLDTDANPATGSLGAEYSLYAGAGVVGIEKWDGTTFVPAAAPSLGLTVSGNVAEFRIARKDIDNVSRLGLVAATVLFGAADEYLGEDDAPDSGEYLYVLEFAQCANGKDDDGDGKIDAADYGCSSPTDNLESDDPVTLKVGKTYVRPAKARAGKVVVVAVPVARVETGRPIATGTVRCSARIGAKALRGAGKLISGNAACAFRVPGKATKGKVVRGILSVTHLGARKVVSFSFRVN